MESTTSVPDASRSLSGRLQAAVTFVCERLSLAVVAVGTIVMVLVFVIVEIHSTHIGFYPIVFERNDDRIEVISGEYAGGLQTGDRINLQALTPEERFSLIGGAPVNAEIAVQASRDGRSFPVRLRAGAADYSPRARLTRDVGIPLSFFLSLALASTLFLMRPRPITLAFYFYTMLMLVKVNQTSLDIASWPINVVSDLAIQVVYPLAQLMILIFAQRLYGKPSRAWPWIFGSAIVLSVFGFVSWVDPTVWIVTLRYGFPGPTTLFMSLTDVALLLVVLCGLAYIASGATALDRTRVSWVVAGIALAPILDLTWALANGLSTLIGNTSSALQAVQHWTDALGPWFGLVGSIFVVYGFLSERVIDFRFAIGRAAIYGAVTAVMLLFFGALEWWAQQIFETTRPAIYLSLVAALLIGVTLNAIHGRVENFLGSILFRDQRRAEEALRHASRALANTSSEKTLVEFLVNEPVRVLGLTEAALFVSDGEGGDFRRRADVNWTLAEAERIDAEDPLIVELRAELAPIALDGRPRAETILPGGSKAPSLVVPLMMRGNVFGFVFYGARASGLPFTQDERALLESIARSAAAAFDHIDADRSRAHIAELEERIRELGGTVSG
ncbi:MAG TPA: GAF domain-containing protein [Candidatus Binatia bacterium]|nr:GAF domain-containing protein [Candidatus Binatia bacterium]